MDKLEKRKEFGKHIADLRASRGLSQRDLAGLCLVDKSNIAKLEMGIYNASFDILSKIADALGAEIDIIKRD